MATAGYSGTPLVRKLGLRAGVRVRLLDEPADYWTMLDASPEELGVQIQSGDGPARFTHLFATERRRLHELFAVARRGTTDDGMVWASWPKKSSGVESEVTRAEVMEEGHAVGLVDVKVAAIDGVWSGLKFVVRVADRIS